MINKFKVPWAAWRDPEFLELTFPNSWNVSLYKMNGSDAPELKAEEIRNSILNPIGTPKISELGKDKTNTVIVIDDMTRPTPISKIIPYVLEELKQVGIDDDQITIILAVGAHRPMTRHDCILKLGEDLVNRLRIVNHHPYENLTYLGESSKGTPIYVNTSYIKADLKIAIGGVIPHPLAGFGGGAKIVLPGVCGIKTLEANHSAGVKGQGGGIGRMTDARRDIEEIAEKVGLDFSINVILSDYGKISKIFSGHFKQAHREAMEFGKEFYSTKIGLNNNICFFNSYPEDSELNQAQYKPFNFLMTAPRNILDNEGAIVIMTASYEGRGYHSLLGEIGTKLYRNLGDSILWKIFVDKRKVYLFSPNVNKFDKDHYFPKSVKLIKNWDDLIQELKDHYGDSPNVAVVPSSIQLAENTS
ncbi:MAG: nickel-dependent lactate racemase [Promethearchaeota archaeon]